MTVVPPPRHATRISCGKVGRWYDPHRHARKYAFLAESHFREKCSGFDHYDPTVFVASLSLRVTPFMAWPLIGVTLFASAVTLFTSAHREWLPAVSLSMDVHMLLGGALSFIAVFRTQSSYDRWWEARKAWQDVVTVSRGMASSAAVALADADAAELMMMKLVGFMLALKAFLRGTEIPAAELGSLLDPAYVDDLNASECPPLAALRSLSETVKRSLPQDDPDTLFDEGSLAASVFTEASADLRALHNAFGVCERIRSTPMTFGYVASLRSVLMLWLLTFPLSLVGSYGWIAPAALLVITYIFLTIEQMAVEIEQPFGDDPNDLPLEEYILDFEALLLEVLPELSQRRARAEARAARAQRALPCARPEPNDSPGFATGEEGERKRREIEARLKEGQGRPAARSSLAWGGERVPALDVPPGAAGGQAATVGCSPSVCPSAAAVEKAGPGLASYLALKALDEQAAPPRHHGNRQSRQSRRQTLVHGADGSGDASHDRHGVWARGSPADGRELNAHHQRATRHRNLSPPHRCGGSSTYPVFGEPDHGQSPVSKPGETDLYGVWGGSSSHGGATRSSRHSGRQHRQHASPHKNLKRGSSYQVSRAE